MKKISLSLVLLLLLGAVACRKNNALAPITTQTTANVSTSDAADMVASSLSSNSNGITNISDDVTFDAASYARAHLTCGTLRADTISRTSAAGATTTYSYHLTYNYVVNCGTNNKPSNLSSSLVYSGNFNGPRLSSTNSGSTVFSVDGLDSAATDFVLNGEYKNSGSFNSKVDTTNHGTWNTDIVVTALTLKKPARTIVSGTATISITGSVPKKGSFSYTGTLVFNGDGTATLTINGTVYKIDLATGEKTKV